MGALGGEEGSDEGAAVARSGSRLVARPIGWLTVYEVSTSGVGLWVWPVRCRG